MNWKEAAAWLLGLTGTQVKPLPRQALTWSPTKDTPKSTHGKFVPGGPNAKRYPLNGWVSKDIR